MKFSPVILASLTLASYTVWGQVTVEVDFEQEQFLRNESIPLKVRITNRSGQTLQLGAEPAWLSFHLEDREGRLVSPLRELAAPGEFALESSRIATRQVDLMPLYDLDQGRYFLSATVRIPKWDQEVTSPRKVFEVIRGIKLWQETVGVPAQNGPPEARKYILEQANYLRRPFLYARLTDSTENRVFGVRPLGRLLSFGQPVAQIDRLSNLHVLFQTGPRDFTYCVLNPQAQLIRRQRHDYNGPSRPTLKSDGQGQINVVGGVRRLTRYDIPPPQDPEQNHEGVTPAP